MYRPSAVLGGAVAGAVGAAGWAGIAYVTGFEIGWIAWGVGLAVGLAVAAGSRGEGSLPAGVLAATLAALSVAAGKYLLVAVATTGLGEAIGPLDVVFFGLAIFTAWRIGRTGGLRASDPYEGP